LAVSRSVVVPAVRAADTSTGSPHAVLILVARGGLAVAQVANTLAGLGERPAAHGVQRAESGAVDLSAIVLAGTTDGVPHAASGAGHGEAVRGSVALSTFRGAGILTGVPLAHSI